MLALCAWACAGCAVNFSEARPARILRGGEVQLAQINNVVVPTSAIGDSISSTKSLYTSLKAQEKPSNDQARDYASRATAIALAGPGYATHFDIGVGLGYRWDTSLRVGNGIYAASLRKGYDFGPWAAALGLRAGYNSGQSVISYLDDANGYVDLVSTKRFDGQLFAQLGREFGEWGRLWFGAKGMYSGYTLEVGAPDLGLQIEKVSDHIWFWGGNIGVAVGFRHVFAVGELTVLRASGSLRAFGRDRDLGGVTIAPSWGIMGQF
ncbi:MAG: hypothetical protein HY902_16805 [Deltaproteobacteria bacterium]|nr:hypothetical protein [Deltaproteobacteria bacterium]